MGELARTIKSLAEVPSLTEWARALCVKGLQSGPVTVVLTRPSRSVSQNAKLHICIEDIRTQCFRASGRDAMKAVLVSQFAEEMTAAGTPLRHPGETAWDWVNQRPVYVRPSTTKFTKRECAEFIEFLHATGAELGVEWSDRALAVYDEYREATAA